MLDRKGQAFDMQEIILVEQTVRVDAQHMCGEFAVQSGTQSHKSMGIIALDLELHAQVNRSYPLIGYGYDSSGCSCGSRLHKKYL